MVLLPTFEIYADQFAVVAAIDARLDVIEGLFIEVRKTFRALNDGDFYKLVAVVRPPAWL